jgi:hypothetical protein
MAAVSIAFAACCCGVGIVGVQGLHVTDNTNEFHNDIDVVGKVRHNAEPSLGSAAAHHHRQDHHQHNRNPFADENTMEIQEFTFRRAGAGFAKLGRWCNMNSFYTCDWQGMIGNKKKMKKLDVEEKPGFTLASKSSDANGWGLSLPSMFGANGKGQGDDAMNVKASVIEIFDTTEILDMINRNPTLVSQMLAVKHPHIVVAVVTAEVFDSAQDADSTNSGEVDQEGLEAAGKLAYKAAKMYGTGGLSALTGLEEIDSSPLEADLSSEEGDGPKKGYESPEDEAPQRQEAKTPALSGKSHTSSSSTAVYQPGTIIAYDLKKVLFTDNRWFPWESAAGKVIATQLVSNTPDCLGKDGLGCIYSQKMGYVKEPYVEGDGLW